MANNAEGLSLCMFGLKRFGREGGVEVVVEELSTRMVKLGHQVTCYTRGGHHVSGKEFDGESLSMDSQAGILDGLIFVFAFSVDEIKDGFMSNGGKDNIHSSRWSMGIC